MPIDYPEPIQAEQIQPAPKTELNQEESEFMLKTPYNAEEPIFSLEAEVKDQSTFYDQALWGPIYARMIPNTKKTMSRIVSRNIKSLNRDEYDDLRFMIEYVAKHDELKERMFELTGFDQKDLNFARKYFMKYQTKPLFARIVKVGLSTSSHGRVSKQIGGLVRFIFETEEMAGVHIPVEYKLKLIGGILNIVEHVWQRNKDLLEATSSPTYFHELNPVDLNENGEFDLDDTLIGAEELAWLKEYRNKAIKKIY